MEKMILVSADGHAGPPPEGMRPYLEPMALEQWDGIVRDNEQWVYSMDHLARFSDERLAIIDDRDAIRSGGETGAWDLGRRIKEMDDEGIAAEALIHNHQLAIPPFFSPMCSEWSPELQVSGRRSSHRWLADHMAGMEHRFIAMAYAGPCLDMDEAVREMNWVADHGFKMVELPGNVARPELPSLLSSHYEPFWRTCSERGLALNIHAGWGQRQDWGTPYFLDIVAQMGGGDFDVTNSVKSLNDPMMMAQDTADPFALTIANARAMWKLMLAGVFDRYPNLKLVLTELRADWVPAMLAVLDARVDKGDTGMKMKPSEYYARNVYMGASSTRQREVAMRREIGLDKLMFGRDYPHPEGTWPNTWDWIRDAFAGVPEAEARLLLGENAIDCFGLDRAKLAEIAERIGPEPSVLLGDYTISRDLIDSFDARSGYLKPKNIFNEAEVHASFDDDLATLAVV